jgi:hypothetical protein
VLSISSFARLNKFFRAKGERTEEIVGGENVVTEKPANRHDSLLSADDLISSQQNHTLVASCLTCASHKHGKDDSTQRLSLPAVGAPFSASSEAAAAFAFGLGAAFGFGFSSATAGFSPFSFTSTFLGEGFFSAEQSAFVRTSDWAATLLHH